MEASAQLLTWPIIHSETNLRLKIAENAFEIEQAFKLRYQVFVEETKNLQLFNELKLETDVYDAFCDHLIVLDESTNAVVGTYRLLPGNRIKHNIGFYSETEFNLSAFRANIDHTLELGRSCVAEPYRGGKTIQMLWEGIAAYIAQRGYTYLIGCASVNMKNEMELNEIYSLLLNKQVITSRFDIQPLETHRMKHLQYVDIENREKELFRKLPPLMKGYQWLGAEIGGDPAYDAVFDTVDFLIVLHKDQISRRYRRHFMEYKA